MREAGRREGGKEEHRFSGREMRKIREKLFHKTDGIRQRYAREK
jgi:hypothetical protein